MSIVIPTDVRGRIALDFHVTNSPSPDFLPTTIFRIFVGRLPQLVAHVARWWHYRAVTLLDQPRGSSAHEYRRGAAGTQDDTAYRSNALNGFCCEQCVRIRSKRCGGSTSAAMPSHRQNFGHIAALQNAGEIMSATSSKLLARIRRSCSLYSTTRDR
jgi:hypothetical protein